MAILLYIYFGVDKTKENWKTITKVGTKICPKCVYYDQCYMDHDCKALEILADIYENLDCSDPDQ